MEMTIYGKNDHIWNEKFRYLFWSRLPYRYFLALILGILRPTHKVFVCILLYNHVIFRFSNLCISKSKQNYDYDSIMITITITLFFAYYNV